MTKKGKFFIGLGVLLFAGVAAWAVMTVPKTPQKPNLDEGSKVMEYTGNHLSEEKDGRKIWELDCDSMRVNAETKDVEMENISGTFYAEDGREFSLQAKHGTYVNDTKQIVVDGNVYASTSDGSELSCDKIEWEDSEQKLSALGNAVIRNLPRRLEATGDSIVSTDMFQKFKIEGHAHIDKGVGE